MHYQSNPEKQHEHNPQHHSNKKHKLSHLLHSRRSHHNNYSHQDPSLHNSLNRKHSQGDREAVELKAKLNQTIDLRRQQPDIYFNRTKKYNYMKQIIDKYFEETKREKGKPFYRPGQEDVEIGRQYQTMIPRISKQHSQEYRKSQHIQKSYHDRVHQDVSGNKKHQRTQRLKRSVFIHRKNENNRQEDQKQGQSLIQSRLLMKDNQEQLQIDFTRSLSFPKSSSSLPPIDQIFDDRDEDNSKYDSISYLNQSQAELAVPQNKVVIMQNEAYVVELVMNKGRPSHHIKTYNQIGLPLLGRQKKAFQMGISTVWVQYKYDQNALIRGPGLSLKDLLFKAKRVDLDSKFYTLKTKKYHKKLLTNKCQQLKRVIRQFSQFMEQVQGRVVNHKINTGNLYIVKNDNWRLAEWGYSSFKTNHLIQGMEFENRVDPILKSKTEWFIPPEYMAPEIIRAVAFGQEGDLTALGSALDIWSLGVAIFQILTIVPVWIVQKCVVHGKQMPSRSGLLAIGNRDLKRMLKREQRLPYLMSKVIEQQCGGEQLDQNLLNLMYRCVDYNPLNRPSYSQITQTLK